MQYGTACGQWVRKWEDGISGNPLSVVHLDITNLETVSMFSNMFKGWFAPVASNYNEFIRALLEGNVKAESVYE